MSCKGYILKDFLLGIIVFMMLFPVVVKSAEIVSGLNFVDAQLGDELSILQLRRKMIISENIVINGNSISFIIGDTEFTLKYEEHRLYLTPGYQLFLNDIDGLRFKNMDGMIFIEYEKNNKRYERYIAFV
ncbi:MAG: hypothetical protein PUC68_05730 [Firmicutes bacterium]|nr:hypothetical protein [Bacillota bacterium]MDY3092544.1 hypothetical protein [Erysipelotrichaceae bacterium]